MLELSQSLQAQNNPTKRYTDIGDERAKVACGQSSGSFSTNEKGLSNDLMDGSMLESQARVLCCWLGLAPVFHRRLLACHSPFSRDLSIDIIPWANLDTWEGQEVKQAGHGKKKSLSPGAGANKSQWMQKVQRGFIALPRQGLGRQQDSPLTTWTGRCPFPTWSLLGPEAGRRHMLALSRCSREL